MFSDALENYLYKLEAALIDYFERYGLTERARAAFATSPSLQPSQGMQIAKLDRATS